MGLLKFRKQYAVCSWQSSVDSVQAENYQLKTANCQLKIEHSCSLTSKQKASSLMEVIVASVIIVVIFGIVTLTLNNIIKNNYRTKTDQINNRLNKIIYLHQNGKISIPFKESFESWEIESNKSNQNNIPYLEFTAVHQKTKKEVTKKVFYAN